MAGIDLTFFISQCDCCEIWEITAERGADSTIKCLAVCAQLSTAACCQDVDQNQSTNISIYRNLHGSLMISHTKVYYCTVPLIRTYYYTLKDKTLTRFFAFSFSHLTLIITSNFHKLFIFVLNLYIYIVLCRLKEGYSILLLIVFNYFILLAFIL